MVFYRIPTIGEATRADNATVQSAVQADGSNIFRRAVEKPDSPVCYCAFRLVCEFEAHTAFKAEAGEGRSELPPRGILARHVMRRCCRRGSGCTKSRNYPRGCS